MCASTSLAAEAADATHCQDLAPRNPSPRPTKELFLPSQVSRRTQKNKTNEVQVDKDQTGCKNNSERHGLASPPKSGAALLRLDEDCSGCFSVSSSSIFIYIFSLEKLYPNAQNHQPLVVENKSFGNKKGEYIKNT